METNQKIRRFGYHSGSFGDNTDYVEFKGDIGEGVRKDGSRYKFRDSLEYALNTVSMGTWIELEIPDQKALEDIFEVANKLEVLMRKRVAQDKATINSLIYAINETNQFAFELMNRAAAIDEKLAVLKVASRDCELGQIVRMRQQISRNRALIEGLQAK